MALFPFTAVSVIRCQFIFPSERNPVSVHISERSVIQCQFIFPSVIQCQFIFPGKNDEPTPDFPADTGFPRISANALARLDLVINNAGVGADRAVRYARCLGAPSRLRDQRFCHGRSLPRVVAPPGRRPRPRDGHHGLGQCPPCSAGPVRILCQQVRRHRIHGSDSHRMAAVRHPRSSGRPGIHRHPL